MRRHLYTLVLALVAVAAAQPAGANWFTSFCQRYKGEAIAINIWPEQFLAADRMAVRAPFGVMVANGWQMQNTLADHHFDADGQLNEAGQLKVMAIVIESPVEQRTVFVLRSAEPETTSARIASVHEAAQKLAALGTLNDVVETPRAPRGTHASHIDTVQRRWTTTTPDPRIPELERPSDD